MAGKYAGNIAVAFSANVSSSPFSSLASLSNLKALGVCLAVVTAVATTPAAPINVSTVAVLHFHR